MARLLDGLAERDDVSLNFRQDCKHFADGHVERSSGVGVLAAVRTPGIRAARLSR
jgi:hypothetical protein